MALFENLSLEKGMYNVSGKSFTDVLEGLDPSENYKGTKLDGLDAFERQLKRFDIKLSGRNADCIDKFFSTSTAAALFPEYVKRVINVGIKEDETLKNIIASKTYIDSMDYRSITSVVNTADKSFTPIAEGSSLPETVISASESLVSLKKRGRLLVASYEAIKFQKIDLFSVTLRQIGNQMAKQLLKDAITVLVSGDGNSNIAGNIDSTGSALAYSDLLRLWGQFDDFDMNTLIASPTTIIKLLSLSEFKDYGSGINWKEKGKMITPLGANLYRSNSIADDLILGIDKNNALEMVSAGDLMIEHDKMIDKQFERASITSITGFSKIFRDATKTLTIG